MARRSRAVVETVKAKFRVWRIAIYIRLSKEDARCLDESESVTNQRQIIEDHIAGFHDGDEYIIVDEYVDVYNQRLIPFDTINEYSGRF